MNFSKGYPMNLGNPFYFYRKMNAAHNKLGFVWSARHSMKLVSKIPEFYSGSPSISVFNEFQFLLNPKFFSKITHTSLKIPTLDEK